MHRYFRRYFEQRTALNESAILNDLNPQLRAEVSSFLMHEAVRRNALFAGLRGEVLAQIFLAPLADRGHAKSIVVVGLLLLVLVVLLTKLCKPLRIAATVALTPRLARIVRGLNVNPRSGS